MFNKRGKIRSFLQRVFRPFRVSILAVINFLGSSITQLERFFKRLSQRASQANQVLGEADTKVSTFFSRLFHPFKVLFAGIASAFSWASGKLGISYLFKRIRPYLYWLVYPFVALASFLLLFFRTRSRRLIVWSIPLILLGAAVFVLLWQVQSNRRQMTRSYLQAIDQAVASGAFDEAQLLRQKLIQLGARRDQLELQRIEELAETGEWRQAIAEAERLSPLDSPGLGAGHLWLVRQYLQGRPDNLSKQERLERASMHLDHVKTIARSFTGQRGESQPEIVYLEASLLIDGGQVEEGLQLLASISDRFFPALILSMEVNAQVNRIQEAVRNSVELSEVFKKSPEIGNQLTENFFPLWCVLLGRSGDVERFRDGIRLWYSRFPENEAALLEWSKIQFQEIELLASRGGGNDLNRATSMLLETSGKYSLNHRDWLSGWFLPKLPPNNDNPNFQTLADRAAASPSASPVLLEILGTAAYLRQQPELAIELLDRAIDLDSTNAVALNNLAFILATEFDDSKKSRALELVEKAVELVPQNAEMRETRGMLLIHFKQWERGIEDLTFVIANGQQKPELHAALARAYRAVGKIEMASLHQSQAE